MDPNVILNRIIRLAKLDTTVFDEVRDDAAELVPALIVAGVSAMLAGLGAWLWFLFNFDKNYRPDNIFLNSFILGGLFMAAMYAVWVLIAYVVIVQIYKATADLQSLFRTMGYAGAAMALSVLMFIPILYPVFAIIPLALLFVLTIYAVQSASNAESTQVVMANLAGSTVFVLILSIVAFSSDTKRIGAGLFAMLIKIP